MTANKKPTVLFVLDSATNADVLKNPVLHKAVSDADFDIAAVRGGKNAQVLIAGDQKQVAVVLADTNLSDIGPFSLARFAKTKSVDIKVFALLQANANAAEYPAGEIAGATPFPPEPEQIKQLLIASRSGFHKSQLLNAKTDSADAGATVLESDDSFVGIRAKGLVTGKISHFDVYIRLGAGKYVKLIRSGDVPPVDQIKRYVSKGIGFFFIRKDIQETYVRYCEQVANALISNANISLDTKVNQTMNQGVETLSLIQTHGVNDPTMGYASRFVLNVSKVVREYDLVSNDEIARFLGNVSSYEHNTSVAAMSGMLALALKLDSEKSAHIIGMAGLLHDVGMMKLGLLEGAGEREDEMTPEERAIYETHPLVGAEELAKLKRFDPAVIQSVAQHHFRRDGSGFPSRSHFTHIHICAEIVGICDEYDYRVRRKRRMPHLNVASEMEKVYPLFSKQVVQAFLNTFMKDEAPLLSDGQILI